MPLPDAARWSRLSPLLDELLDLDDPARAARLAAWQQDDASLADELRALLAAHARVVTSGFFDGTADAGPRDAAGVGTGIGAYRLEAVLGEGGSGTVWRACRADGQFEGHVAIKLLHRSRTDAASLARFRSEAGILARLTHPNIAKLFDAGVTAGGRPYLILELIDGEPLDVHADACKLTIRQRIELFRQVTLAVAHAHSHLAVHRDIKPTNILVDREGVVKLLDFGIAELLDADAATASDPDGSPAEPGRFLTPAYAAPEQLSGEPMTTATDVYALGIVLHGLLAGGHPTIPAGSTTVAAIRSTLDAEPLALHAAAEARAVDLARTRGTSARRLVRALRGDLDAIVARCLRKAPGERYATAAELGEDLRRHLDGDPVQAAPDSTAYRAGKFVRKHRVAASASLLVTAVLVAATLVSTWQLLEARRQHRDAVAAAAKAQASSRFLTLMVGEIGVDDGARTPAQIIDRGIWLLDQQHNETAPMVDQLEQMGGYYARFNEPSKELATLVRAEALSRRIGYDEGLARVLCGEVDSRLALDQPERARAGLDEARRIVAALARPAPVVAAICESAAAAIDDAAGDSRKAVTHAERALALLAAAQRLDDPIYAAIATRLSKYYDDLGDAREAHRYTEVAVAAYDRAGADGTIDRLTVLNNEAADFVNFGQLRDALEVADKVMQRLDARGGGPAVGLGFAANRAAILSSLGRHADALSAVDRALADARASDNAFWQLRTRYYQARILLRAGAYDRARDALDAVERGYRQDAAGNREYLQYVTVTRAEWLFRTGDLDAADTTMRGLLQTLREPGQESPWVLRSALPIATEIALARHDVDLARARANAMVDLARAAALDPARSADLGRALILLARAQRAAGDEPDARRSIQDGVPSLIGGLGPDHPEVRDASLLLTQGLGP